MKSKIYLLVVVLFMGGLLGCGGGGSDSGSGSSQNVGDIAQEYSVVNSGQGVPGSATYSPNGSAVFLTIHFDQSLQKWLNGSGMGLWPLTNPRDKSIIQLVLIMSITEHNTGIQYTNGAYFYHATCHAELRVALTGSLLASADFAGDNLPPRTTTSRTGPSDEYTMVPAIEAWLARYR